MAAAAPETYDQFVGQILRPTNFTSLKDPVGDTRIQVQVFTGGGPPSQEFIITNMYPFQTIGELQTRIYIESGLRDEFHPENQCILKPIASAQGYTNFLYVFNNTNYELANPFTQIQAKPDPRFVDLVGNAKLIQITPKSSLLLESTLFIKPQETYVLHLFLYRDIYQAYQGAKPISRTDWEGLIRPYFSEKDKAAEDGSLTVASEGYKADLVKRYECRQKMIEFIDEHLQGTPLRKPGETSRGDNVSLANVRNLRFHWKRPQAPPLYKSFDIESVFYDMPVSPAVPFMRYFPKAATPISKIHVEGSFNIPTIEVPELLLQWSEQKSLTPEEGIIMLKVLLRPGSGSVMPLFATMFIHEDGSAKFIIQPDQNTKILTKQGDLFGLAEALEKVSNLVPKLIPIKEGISAKTIYTPQTITLDDAYSVLSLWLEKDDTRPITKKSLMAVLPFYRPFFQVTSSPLEFQSPISFLRYKAVNNFVTPARDAQLLGRILDLQKLVGVSSIPQLVKYYMEEFDVPEQVAQARVRTFLEDTTKFELTDPTTLDYKQSANPGMDIAVFGKQPFYTFHLYRIDSVTSLRRIKTIISLLITLEAEEFEEIRKCYLTAEQEEQELQALANEEALADATSAAAEGPETPAVAVAAADQVANSALAPNSDTFAFDGLGDFGGFGEEVADAPAPSLQALAAADAPGADAPEAAAPEAPQKPQEPDDDEDITDVSQLKETKSKTYFSKRLDFYDQRLFQYAKGKKDLTKYSSACAANALKQPVVMSEDEFARMKETYETDIEAGKVLFIEYPLKKGQVPPTPSNTAEVITTLRYGSNLMEGQANIYICSELWCRKDDIVVLKSDYESTTDRKGRHKDKNTCPFCHGGAVKDRLSVVPGETVIERMTKGKGESKRHLKVSFLGKMYHPQGLYLPCCFITDHKLYEDKHPAFAGLKRASAATATGEPVADLGPVDDTVQYAVDYRKKLGSIRSWYVLGAEKQPLEVLKEGPQIGILPQAVDAYFKQDSRKLVINDHTVWKLISRGGHPSVSGFLRIGVENRKRYQPEAFMAAIAPYYGENSAAGMKRRIMDLVQPLMFMSLNYGNFLFDFYDPTMQNPPPLILKMFASKQLGLESGVGAHAEASIRAWKGFRAFETFMASTKAVKEFRQFAQILTLPDLLHWDAADKANGIMFIVLEVRTGETEVQVRCPPYGVSKQMAARCDVAFILSYDTGAWEPVFYTENDAELQTSNTFMVFSRDASAGWPAAVKERVEEYEKMCFSSGLGIYTDSAQMNPKTLLPLATAMQIDAPVKAILRDIYNHVAGVLFSTETGTVVLVPAIDDGSIHPAMRVELDWRNFMRSLASATAAKEFYDTKVQAIIAGQPAEIRASYGIQSLWRLDKSVPERPDLHAFHLSNGLIVPVKKPEGGEAVTLESEALEEGQEAPWMIDTKLVYGSKEAVTMEMNFKEFEEVYQHFRLTFANWYAVQPAALKDQVNGILYKLGLPNNTIPLYEKRQRLFIILGNELLSWLDSSVPMRGRKPSLKRVDCRVQAEETCSNRCVWTGDEQKGCLLHVPATYEIGASQVDTKSLLVKKLIEELIRFPIKRLELTTNKVNKYVKLLSGFRAGDQYIVPEDSGDWFQLLRLEWTKDTREQPRHLEEYVAVQPAAEAADADAAEPEPELVPGPVPELLVNYIRNPKLIPQYSFYTVPQGILPVLESLGMDTADLEAEGQVLDAPILLTQELANFVAKRLKVSVYQLMYEPDSPLNPSAFISVAMYEEKTRLPFLFIVQLDDGRVGMLTMGDMTPIPFPKLPGVIQKNVLSATKILV